MSVVSDVRCLSVRTFTNLVNSGLVTDVDYFYYEDRRSGGVRAYINGGQHDVPEELRCRYSDRPAENGRNYLMIWWLHGGSPCERTRLEAKRDELMNIVGYDNARVPVRHVEVRATI